MNPTSTMNSFSLIAPRDIFERKYIGYANGERIMCKGIKEGESDKEYTLIYLLTNTIQLNALPSILRAFETDKICFAKCECWGYDENDHRIYCAVNKIEDVDSLHNYWSFKAVFCNRETKLYRFSLWADVNASGLSYYVTLKDFNKKYCL